MRLLLATARRVAVQPDSSETEALAKVQFLANLLHQIPGYLDRAKLRSGRGRRSPYAPPRRVGWPAFNWLSSRWLVRDDTQEAWIREVLDQKGLIPEPVLGNEAIRQ